MVRKLVDYGAKVIVLDNFFTGRKENLWGLENKYTLVEGCVTNKDLVRELVSQSEFVFHLTAKNIIASTKNPYDDLQTNIIGTFNVLSAAREFKINKVIYTSSVSIYGNPKYLPINEDDAVNLLTPYAVSKFSGEGYCQAFYESYGVPVTVVRYSNVYGPGQDPYNPYCGVISKFMYKIEQGELPEIHGNWQQTRDFTYIEDAVDATIAAGVSYKTDGECFNIGTGVETSINQLAKLILNLYSINKAPIYIDKRDIDNIRRRVLNIEKIRKTLRWTPKYTLEEGLKRTKHWMSEFKNIVLRTK